MSEVNGFSIFISFRSYILFAPKSSPSPLKSLNPTQVTAAAAAKSLQSCLTLWHPIDSSPPGSAISGVFQARTLEWLAISFSNARKWKVKVKSLSRVRLLATSWTAAHQAPPSMGFSRQEYWSGVPLPSPLKSLFDHKLVKLEAKVLSVVTQGAPPIPVVAFIHPPLRVRTVESFPPNLNLQRLLLPYVSHQPRIPQYLVQTRSWGTLEWQILLCLLWRNWYLLKKAGGRCPCSLCPSAYSRYTLCLLLPVIPRLKPVRGGLSLSCP